MKELFQMLSRDEKSYIWKLALIIIIITTLPYIYGILTTPEGQVFNGLHSLTTGDLPVYYSYIEQIKSGQITLYNNFSFETPQNGLFNIFWLITGLIARLFHLPPSITIHITRIALIYPLIYIIYVCISFFFTRIQHRKIATYITILSSGISTYAIPFITKYIPDFYNTIKWPIDYWIPESTTFNTLYHLPHVIASLGLMLLIYITYLYGFFNRSYLYASIAGLYGLILFNFHPYHVVSIYLILGIFTLHAFIKYTDKKTIVYYYCLTVLISLPSPLYHVYMLATDPIIQARAHQNITITPPILYVILGYGGLLIGSIYALYIWIKNKKLNDLYIFLIIWVCVTGMLIYSPLNFQSRFLQGVHIPLAIMTSYSIIYIQQKKKWSLLAIKPIGIFFFILIFGMTPIVHLTRDLILYHDNYELFYTPKSHIEAFTWIQNNASINDVTLSNYTPEDMRLSFFLTGYTNTHTYVSHMHESINYESKHEKLQTLLNSTSLNEWNYFFEDNNVKYIIKKQSTPLMYPVSLLTPVFSNADVIIYSTPTIIHQ